jgi:hypothetical protein
MVVADAFTVTAGVRFELTVIVTELDVADVGEAQLAVEVITQETTSP